MNRNILFNVILGGMFTATVASLSALGEARLDVYLSLFTLEYFIAMALLRPRRRTWDFLALILMAVFLFIVGLRLAEILLK